MTRIISEGINPNTNGFVNEGMITFNMKDLASYVSQEDKRIKQICESLEFTINEDFSNVTIDRQNNLACIKEGNDTLKLFLKQSLIDNMDNYFKLRF